MQAFRAHLPDLAIIDISLEDEAEGGFDLCRDLRALSAELPIIFLTARDSELDAVSGLRLGADDFLTKDVSLPHLAARVAALFRRIDALRRPVNAAEIVRRGALSIDGEKMQTTWNGAPVTLSLTEFWIVHALARNPGPRQEPPATDGCRERGTGRQHHHLAHQARAAQIPRDRRQPSMRFKPSTEWAIAGSSEHPPSTADRRAHHPGSAVGRLPICRELETALRVSQENALEASADTIAHALSAQPARVFRDADDIEPFAQEHGDLYVFPLHRPALARRLSGGLGSAGGSRAAAERERATPARLQAGYTERYLFLYLEVDDPHFVAEPADVHPERDRFDRVDLTLQTARRVAASPISSPPAHRASSRRKPWSRATTASIARRSEPRIQAFWLQTSRGYHLEARLPLSLVGARLWIEARDAGGDRSAGFAADATLRGGRLFMSDARDSTSCSPPSYAPAPARRWSTPMP